MTRGIYTAATGMLAEEAAQQVIAQNLANSSTTGYKQDIPVFKSFDETLVSLADSSGIDSSAIGSLGHGAVLDRTYTDLSQGPLQATGNSLDVALSGDAYLRVQTPAGPAYTRDGAMTLNAQGTLVQVGSGYPILSDRGLPIVLPNTGASSNISTSGVVSVDGQTVGTLGLFAIDQANQPSKLGDNLISAAIVPKAIDTSSASGAYVQSGYLEASNVNVVKEMVTMIACSRSYEANEKLMQSQDQMQNEAVTTVGQVA